MTARLISILFSDVGYLLVPIVLVAAICLAWALGVPVRWRWVGAVAIAVHLSSGWFYRSGEAACSARVAAAVELARVRDQATIATLRRELDRQDEENAAAERQLADYAEALRKKGGGCINTQGDADAINR
jgi:hypothetical protein